MPLRLILILLFIEEVVAADPETVAEDGAVIQPPAPIMLLFTEHTASLDSIAFEPPPATAGGILDDAIDVFMISVSLVDALSLL